MEGSEQEFSKMAMLVAPGSSSTEACREIWDAVTDDDVQLPGDWNTTVEGAVSAARTGDAAICTYLAARCGKNGNNLGAVSSATDLARSALWFWVAAPVVIDIPKGQERLWVQVDGETSPEWVGTDKIDKVFDGGTRARIRGRRVNCKLVGGPHCSAEHFYAGNSLELSQMHWRGPKLRRIMLTQPEIMELRKWVPGGECDGNKDDEANLAHLRFLTQDVHFGAVPGGRFHVLAYPLARDVTKALVRPAQGLWTDVQRTAAIDILRLCGESLLSQCAKSNLWYLVELFLQEGVSCKEMCSEFASVCGCLLNVKRQWLRDLNAAGARPGRSLLELAIEAKGDQTFKSVLGAIEDYDSELDLDAGSGAHPPLILAAATSNPARWDIVKVLLEHGGVSALPIAALPSLAAAPHEIQELVQSQIQTEELGGARSKNLKEYFQRGLQGEVVGDELAPRGFSATDGILSSSSGVRILDQGLLLSSNLLAGSSDVKFVSITEEQLASARDTVEEEDSQLLPLDMNDRSVALRDVTCSGCWLAVHCPNEYVQGSGSDHVKLKIPKNCLPHPQIPRPTVTIATTTACCGLALGHVLIHCNGRRVGTTDSNGSLRLALPPGTHVLTAPNQSNGEVSVKVDPGCHEEQEVELAVDGGLFLFQQDMSLDDDKKFGVKLCTNPYSIPTEASSFVGQIQLQDRVASSGGLTSGKNFKSLLSVGTGVKCGEVMQTLKVQPTVGKNGQRWEANPDAEQWFNEMADECMVSLLFSGTPLPLGYLIGAMPAQPPSLALEHAVSTTPRAATTRQRSSGVSRRSAYPASRGIWPNHGCKPGAIACRTSATRRPIGHSAFLDFLGIRPSHHT
eukprot:gnl/MRDRNA2_/MRDRNA2_86715_c0_seq1.p1 gnl/MRDRNA2_/MRDRNA2_86715_c0~~gnl/MRDRNA2_/MRDRNA2_86715_c0_seq1.p1  ORF type:complete len:851 (+),score=150.82 gnl/MRDRNA2_/MRDRNA2_86715_c0_seq1:110-2662(+)